MIAITADSASIPASHKRAAEEFAAECGFRHEYIQTHEFDNPNYVKNDREPLLSLQRRALYAAWMPTQSKPVTSMSYTA